MNPRLLVRSVLLLGAALAALAWFFADKLPPPARLRPAVLADPLQVAVELPALRTTVDGVDYGIERRYTYDIAGVVVSLHHSDTWWDTAHAEWGDHINLMDVCLAWGDNAAQDTYRDVHFSNSQWECRFETHSSQTWKAFRQDQVSNNHLLTDQPAIARAMAAIHVGDQIRLRGFLVNYTIYRNGVAQGTRISSDTRTDSGPGACEVLYVESLDVLDSPGRNWRRLRAAALAAIALGCVAWLRLPARFDAGDN
jgi:hypothetical protein